MVTLNVIPIEKYKKIKKFILHYAFLDCPFGKCLIGLNSDSVCHFSFVVNSCNENFQALNKQWPKAQLIHDKDKASEMVKKIFNGGLHSIKVVSKGTNFEAKVWHTLLTIPEGTTVSYSRLAEIIGLPKAARPVANAVAKNPIAYLIPCHRVINSNGQIHKYRWGAAMKKKLLQSEKYKSKVERQKIS